MPTLMVVVPDRISHIVAKGEYQPRYYNPGNLFDEVHILMTNDDQVDQQEIQSTVGDARLYLHNLPERRRFFVQYYPFFRPWLLAPWAGPLFAATMKLQLLLLMRWALPAVELARSIRPALIRCHSNDYNAFVASQIKKALGIPYVVSLHINPDVNPRRRAIAPAVSSPEHLFSVFFDQVEMIGLRHAELALPVYEPIVPYLKRLGCSNYEVAYNVLDSESLTRKDSYSLHQPVRLISVGRHFELKNPDNIIRALQGLPDVHLTLVGDGPYQRRLEDLARECGVEGRVRFVPAIPNDELCRQLPNFDIFVVHTEHWELSKSVMEALLTGLPVIMNRRNGAAVPELKAGIVMFVDNTEVAYAQAIKALVDDDAVREALGRKACSHAQERWSPAKTEAKYVEIYKRVMAGPGTCAA